MSHLRVSTTGIKEIKPNELGQAANDLVQSLYVKNVSIFDEPKPITQLLFQGQIDAFIHEHLTYKQGGLSDKKDYETSHTLLQNTVLSFASYVDKKAVGDETILKLSTLPYTGAVNNAKALILGGAVATGVKGTPGTLGVLETICNPFEKDVHFFVILSEGSPLPEGTKITENAQLTFPVGAIVPPLIINFNGKRIKTFINLTPKTDYYITYVMLFGGAVSGLSIATKQTCGS